MLTWSLFHVAGASLVQWNRVSSSIIASAHDSDIRIWDLKVSITLIASQCTVIPEIFVLLIFARLIFAVIYYSWFQEAAKKETPKINRRVQSIKVRVPRVLT